MTTKEQKRKLKFPTDYPSTFKLPNTCKECHYFAFCSKEEVERHSLWCLYNLYSMKEVIGYFENLTKWKIKQGILEPIEVK